MPETYKSPLADILNSLPKSLKQDVENSLNAGNEPQEKPTAATDNPAVERCCQARKAAMKGADKYSDVSDGRAAYRNAMPPLSGAQNIRDFVACVAHAMLINVVSGPEGARLLYAAQIAYQSRDARSHEAQRKSPAKPLLEP